MVNGALLLFRNGLVRATNEPAATIMLDETAVKRSDEVAGISLFTGEMV